jgi:hypothetical protein
MPMWVCGLARSGSTMLHEILAAHPGVATQRVKDYPMVFTPCWWRRAAPPRPAAPPRERAHADRILITADSPDALEEMIWMPFFLKCHNPAVSSHLPATLKHTDFEAFYRAHLRKLLLAEGATRYAAKANYHISRLSYLVRLFPDARILIPVREPVSHIASLMRQQQRFAHGQRKHRRALAQMQRSGHFEFGLDRRPINLGDHARVRDIERAWESGQEVLGWARYWAMVYDYLARQFAADELVRRAVLVVRFEALCDTPAEVIRSVCRHCALAGADALIEAFAPRLSRPSYYPLPLTPADIALIHRETQNVASQWGYSTIPPP